MTPLENDKICSIANSLDLVQKFDLKDRFSLCYKTKKFCRYCNSEYRLSTVYQYIDVHRYPLTTPGAALARLAQAPAWPREISRWVYYIIRDTVCGDPRRDNIIANSTAVYWKVLSILIGMHALSLRRGHALATWARGNSRARCST